MMKLKTKSLPSSILKIIAGKGTEPPFCYKLAEEQSGTYLCRQCGLALFRARDYFHSGCGWPSFDEAIKEHVKETLDADGQRIEITCARCDAHLGHVFHEEGFTRKNTRHCVNACSLDFTTDENINDTEEAIFAGGCFWGVEYFLKRLPGVLKTEVGYCGGHMEKPSYQEVCKSSSGHYEAVRVLYDPNKLTYEALVKYFFEIHDPTQIDGQGNDIGQQYCSAIFYYNDEEKMVARKLIMLLEQKGFKIATKLLPISPFYPAEDYHQNYYGKTHQKPYCHQFTKRFTGN